MAKFVTFVFVTIAISVIIGIAVSGADALKCFECTSDDITCAETQVKGKHKHVTCEERAVNCITWRPRDGDYSRGCNSETTHVPNNRRLYRSYYGDFSNSETWDM